MKKIIVLLTYFFVQELHAQTDVLSRADLPWQQCICCYDSLFNYYHYADLDSTSGYVEAGALWCGNKSGLFLGGKGGQWEQVPLEMRLPSPFVISSLSYDSVRKELLVQIKKYKDDTKVFRDLYYSFRKGDWMTKREIRHMKSEAKKN